MTHVMQPAAHFVKTRDAGWTSKPLGLVKLVQGCSQNPSSVSVFLCSAQHAVCASTSSLAVDPWRTEHVGYHAYTKCPAFWSCLDSNEPSVFIIAREIYKQKYEPSVVVDNILLSGNLRFSVHLCGFHFFYTYSSNFSQFTSWYSHN